MKITRTFGTRTSLGSLVRQDRSTCIPKASWGTSTLPRTHAGNGGQQGSERVTYPGESRESLHHGRSLPRLSRATYSRRRLVPISFASRPQFPFPPVSSLTRAASTSPRRCGLHGFFVYFIFSKYIHTHTRSLSPSQPTVHALPGSWSPSIGQPVRRLREALGHRAGQPSPAWRQRNSWPLTQHQHIPQ